MAIKSFVLDENMRKLLQNLHTELFKEYEKSFYEKYRESSICIKTDDPSKVLLSVTFTYDDESEKETQLEKLKIACKALPSFQALFEYLDDVVIVGEYSPGSNW